MLKSKIRVDIKTEIRLSPSSKTYEVWYSVDDGRNFELHKRGFALKDALKETTIVKGHYRLLKDLQK
jgi:hypothetical protein